MSTFEIPPISTLAGTSLTNFFKVTAKNRIEKKFFLKTLLTFLIILAGTPFRWWERIVFTQKLKKFVLKKPPVFIIGHWRSGTTLLHNILCQSAGAAYLTTYQGVFPNYLASKLVFKTFADRNMPEERPSDQMKLDINYPQEDEFAVSNIIDLSYYFMFYFPREYRKYYKASIEFQLNHEKVETWERKYKELIYKAILNSSGDLPIIKNPVNTARVKVLLKMFPQAKFIFLHRNPVTVFLSTQKFFQSILPNLWFYEVSSEEIDDMIFDVYKRLHNDYFAQKALIPKSQLLEIKFEDFEKEPIKHLEKIYADLIGEEFEKNRLVFENYLQRLKGYRKNSYRVSEITVDRILREWGSFMEMWNYSVPEEIEIIEKVPAK